MKVFSGVKVSHVAKTYSPQVTQKANDEDAGKSGKRDTIMISDEARAQLGNWQERSANMIESLMEKRQKVQEAKSKLIERTLEAGEELSTIKEQLGAFDEQIVEIEGQMAAIEAEKREREQREQEEKQKAAAKTQEQSGSEQLTSLLQSVQSLEQVNALKQVKVPIENAHRRLKTEMKNDLERGTFVESKAKKISELAERMRSLDNEVNNQIRKAAGASNDMNEKVSAKEEREEVESESLES